MIRDFQKLFDITDILNQGYMMHDIFNGYPEKDFYSFQIDCLDFLHSAAHFYNEGYDYYFERKQVEYIKGNFPYEDKRIQPNLERMFRNFREAYINLIFFVESFINSIGYDAFLSEITNDEIEQNQLKGVEKISKSNHKVYSNLRNKIKNISKIINSKPIDTSLEPYKSYLEHNVELRNQYVHSSPDKGKTVFNVTDWKEKCDKMIDHECMNLLQDFWKSCYPDKSFPIVIFNLFSGNSFKGHQGKFMAK